MCRRRKAQADGNGVETPMALADYIDIGVFKGAKDEEKPLYMKREKLTQEHQRFTIVVDEQPTRAGIDPYNKLIDRIADDNMIDVDAAITSIRCDFLGSSPVRSEAGAELQSRSLRVRIRVDRSLKVI